MPAPASGPTGPSTGAWLGSQSVFDPRDERKLGRALLSSVLVHGGILLIIALGVGVQQVVELQKQPPVKFDLLYLKAPGPGGGGGGSPQPAPPKKLEVPTPKAPEPVPAPPPPVVPPPTLNAPVTTLSQTLQASGQSSVSFSAVGGGGSGGGIGAGRGNGIGEGTGGGTGGGVFQPGNGVSWPMLIRQVEPAYTSEAMRAKIQGTVYLTATVQASGLLDNIKVSKSLDRMHGLDQAAIDAAKRWLFSPCKKDGAAVACAIQLELDFRLH